jgi:hypothetical protein
MFFPFGWPLGYVGPYTPYPINVRGRQPIGVDQPEGSGSDFPFVRPSYDVQQLFGDLFLSFDDLDDVVSYPLKVSWCYGFGDVNNTPPVGYPTPTHDYDIVITDANDLTVFDSTQASTMYTSIWDDRLLIVEWQNPTGGVCRVVNYLAWTQDDVDQGIVRDYDKYLEVTDGELQASCWYKIPKRLRSIQVGVNNFSSSKLITFEEGYNMELAQGDGAEFPAIQFPNLGNTNELVAGTRASNPLRISAEVGAGLGVFPGCGDVTPEVKTINGVGSSGYQNFTLDSEGCIRNQRPVGLVSTTPREFDYNATAPPWWSEVPPTKAEASAAVEFLNDCKNCCDCEYFAQTYQGIKRQWFLYRDVAEQAEETRDTYQQNIDRWETQKTIREREALRTIVQTDGNCKMSFGFGWCQASKCCVTGVSIWATWLQYVNGVLTKPALDILDCEATDLTGPAECDGIGRRTTLAPWPLDTSGRIYGLGLPSVDPQTVVTLSGRFCFRDCNAYSGESDAVKTQLHMFVTFNGIRPDPATGIPCNLPLISDMAIPSDVQAVWTEENFTAPTTGYGYQIVSDLVPVSSSDPNCIRCDCIDSDVPEE